DVERVVLVADPHTFGVDLVDALPVGVDQVRGRQVVGLQVLVAEAGPLAQLAVPGLEPLGGGGIFDDLVDPRPDAVHLHVVGFAVGQGDRLRIELGPLAELRDHCVPDALGDVGPAVLDQVYFGEPAGLEGGEGGQPLLLPPGCGEGEPIGGYFVVAAGVDRRRGPLEHEQLTGGGSQVRDGLHGGGSGPEDAHPLAGQGGHGCAVWTAAGDRVVPAAGVERGTGERGEALDRGKLGAAERTGAGDDELGSEHVAAVGAHNPTGQVGVPADVGDAGGEQGVVVE